MHRWGFHKANNKTTWRLQPTTLIENLKSITAGFTFSAFFVLSFTFSESRIFSETHIGTLVSQKLILFVFVCNVQCVQCMLIECQIFDKRIGSFEKNWSKVIKECVFFSFFPNENNRQRYTFCVRNVGFMCFSTLLNVVVVFFFRNHLFCGLPFVRFYWINSLWISTLTAFSSFCSYRNIDACLVSAIYIQAI